MLYIACHDVQEANAQAAHSLFASAKLSLPSNFVNPIASALCHRNGDVRSAAAAALSAGIQVRGFRFPILDDVCSVMSDHQQCVISCLHFYGHCGLVQAHPQAAGDALQRIIASYGGGSQWARSGAALALKACAAQFDCQQVPIALDFLLGQGLADADDDVRGQMVSAGVPRVHASNIQKAT